jgi:SAM-dependent methyltransferase
MAENDGLFFGEPRDSESRSALQLNRGAWDRLAVEQVPLARPASDQDFANPLRTVDGIGWLGPSIAGWRVLCLAAGGGRQAPLYAAAGAIVTVVDLSPKMLELDRQVAAARGLALRTIETSMDNLAMLGNASFDAVIHPVSTCYVSRVQPVYEEVARVLRAGGLYISQHKSPQSLQASMAVGTEGGYWLKHAYYSNLPVDYPQEQTSAAKFLREPGATEYVHRWEALIGGLCRAGFVIEDLVEPLHAKQQTSPGDFGHRAQYIAPYVRVKARRTGSTSLIRF